MTVEGGWRDRYGDTEITRALERFDERIDAAGIGGGIANDDSFRLLTSDLELSFDEIQAVVPGLFQQAMMSVAHVQGGKAWTVEQVIASIIASVFTQALIGGMFIERGRHQVQREAA